MLEEEMSLNAKLILNKKSSYGEITRVKSGVSISELSK